MKPPITVKDIFPNSEKDLQKILQKQQKNALIPNKEIREDLVEMGFHTLHHVFVITKLSQQQLMQAKIESVSENTLMWLLPMRFDEERRVGSITYDQVHKDDYIQFRLNEYERVVEGDVGSLFICFKNEPDDHEIDEIFDLVLAKYRFMGGIGAISDVIQRRTIPLHYETGYNFISGKEVVQHWHLRSPHEDDSWSNDINDFQLKQFDLLPNAARLFRLSIEQSDPSTQFLLLWLALECQSGKGPNVKQELQKKKVHNRIIERFSELAKIRGQLAHSGAVLTEKSALLDLFFILRLLCITDLDQIKHAHSRLLEHFEG